MHMSIVHIPTSTPSHPEPYTGLAQMYVKIRTHWHIGALVRWYGLALVSTSTGTIGVLVCQVVPGIYGCPYGHTSTNVYQRMGVCVYAVYACLQHMMTVV